MDLPAASIGPSSAFGSNGLAFVPGSAGAISTFLSFDFPFRAGEGDGEDFRSGSPARRIVDPPGREHSFVGSFFLKWLRAGEDRFRRAPGARAEGGRALAARGS